MSPDAFALWAAVSDAFNTVWGNLASVLIERRFAKADTDWWMDLIDDYSFDDLGWLFQASPVVGPMSTTFKSGAQQATMQIGIVWNVPDPLAVAWARSRAAEMVGRRLVHGRLIDNPDARFSILSSTRDNIKSLVTTYLNRGGSWRDIEDGVVRLPGFSSVFGSYRAEMIARTEVAVAANQGFTTACTNAGVSKVRVVDNARCPVCRPFDGTVQTVQWAQEHPIQHPNCTRTFHAVVA